MNLSKLLLAATENIEIQKLWTCKKKNRKSELNSKAEVVIRNGIMMMLFKGNL